MFQTESDARNKQSEEMVTSWLGMVWIVDPSYYDTREFNTSKFIPVP